jgi:serine O-acetyltransferase
VQERSDLWRALRRDLFRQFVYFPGASFGKKASICMSVEGLWAVAVYRAGRALKDRAGAAKLAWPVFRASELAVRILTGIHLDVEADIGPGFYVGHHGSIYVGPGVEIGADSSIGQMCWVGPLRRGEAPVIGSRVYLGPGCKIVGAVRVGDRAVVGTNAVVLDDVPSETTAVGNPARVVSHVGSDDLIYLGEGAPLASGLDAVRAQAA